jgi:hypothetical protein
MCVLGERTSCYVCLARTGDPATVNISCELHFKVVQVDPATGEVSDVSCLVLSCLVLCCLVLSCLVLTCLILSFLS